MHPGKGFHVYLVSRGFWGWKINEDIAISNEKDSDPFTAPKKSLTLKGKDDIDIILIVSRDKDIAYFIAYDEKGNEYRFNGTINEQESTYLYFTYREEKIIGDLIYEAYSVQDQLLYKE